MSAAPYSDTQSTAPTRFDRFPIQGLAGTGSRDFPLTCVRALALVWLFAWLRSDEILRLRVGCLRWQSMPNAPEPASVCPLDVPTHKTGTEFTKPVDPQVGHAIETWQVGYNVRLRFLPER